MGGAGASGAVIGQPTKPADVAARVVGSAARREALAAEWLAGDLLAFCGEWRMGQAGNQEYRGEGGVMQSFAKVLHTIECGEHSYLVREAMPFGVLLPADYKIPFTKGQKVLVRVETIERQKGKGANRDIVTMSGKVEAL